MKCMKCGKEVKVEGEKKQSWMICRPCVRELGITGVMMYLQHNRGKRNEESKG